ncbi:Down syndrome cell adhesion molecule-like protein Dscam2 isoform X7 [Monomorium pharaonis]|uniref:Down syndrome cell adhesion molecule-like protein Dscam2 isoform X7 n=1 Tax=Monomorium pharaonis TaxID=307658 RepID=UPI0017472A90|nr:Down syndrome cell adhesion molecule-like protein Dscam2 isoform X7 [Monomorium pharaonis]
MFIPIRNRKPNRNSMATAPSAGMDAKSRKRQSARHRSCTNRSAHHVDRGLVLSSSLAPFALVLVLALGTADASYETQGPSFVVEPPSRVEFTNVNGGRVDCTVRGNPLPTVEWLAADGGSITNILGIRHVLGNGTIHFPAFEAEAFRQDVHWAIYKCSAVNSVGAVVSRDVTVRAVVNQRYDPEVQNPNGFLGNNVLMRCNVPSFVRDHVTVTSWLQEPAFNIYPSTMGDGKYHMLPTGELMIINITRSDAQMTYRCRTHHRLTQDTVASSNVGRLQLTEIRGSMPPIINEKLVYMSARLKDTVVIPCVAYANPTPTNRWYYNRNQREEPIEESSGHYVVRDGSLIIQSVEENDAGSYMCTASNSEGSETLEIRLTVSAPLSVHVQPTIQTVDLGKSAYLTCTASGFPQAALYWLKDGQPLRTGARVRTVSSERISVTSVAREDRGMYQCFVRNEYEMAQGIAELRLGEIAPQLVYRFIEQTMQPGPSVSLKCSAAGNPTPQISWLLDGFPLPQNDRLLIGQYVTVYGDVISHVNITTVKPEDGGEYECIASSRAGEARHSARLNIYGLPYVRPMSPVSAVAGKQLYIKCPVAGYPIESIVWEKGDVKLPTNMRQRVANGTLFIDTVQRSADEGTYTCTARNKHNFTSHRSVEVRVLVPPRWTVEPIDQNAVVGHGVSIACQAEGFPIPTVTWKQSIGETPTGGDYRELGYGTESAGVARNGSLVIPRVSRDHAGFYLCQASNGIGPGLSKLIRLTVHAGPQVTVRTRQESVRRGESVILRCEAEGDAPLDLSWRVRDSKIDPNYDVRYAVDNTADASGRVTTELRIIQASHMDRGDYVCVAANAYGRDKATIHLLVQEPPDFPRNLHVAEHGSRSILLAWSSPATDRDASHVSSPITNYIVQYKEAQDVWHEHNTQKLVAGDNTVARVSPLKPATTYHFRVLAENHLGTSAPSDILHVQTDGEVPGGPPRHVSVEPLGPQQLKITWQPPDRSLWNGELLGYTIGYTNLGGDDQLTNTTRVGITGNGDGSHDYRLTGLRKYTQYSIIVKAFNSKGDGPGSDPVTAQTFEDVPSAPPQNVACAALNGQNIQVTWKPPPSDKVHGVVLGYKLLYEAASDSQTGRETKVSHALSTVLHTLSPYTNYTVQVLAYTRAGDGVGSSSVSCTTGETVPDAPERVKAVVSGENAVVISWLPPRRPNGLLTQYTVYIRVLEQGQEVKITKSILPAQNLHHEATGLKMHETYEAWVTASTKVGQGSSTPVIKLQPSTTVPAAIISYGVPIVVPWRVDVNMACLVVGDPRPTVEWRRADMKLQQKADVGPDNTLTLRNVQRSHEDNYSCHAKNPLGTDEITYTLHIQVPPTSPTLLATGTTTDAIQLQWKQGDNGGAPIKGFLLAYRREFAEWEEVMLDRRESTHLLEGLQCGTRYQFTLAAFNRIGSGSASEIQTAKTNGSKPVPPPKHHFVRPNQTFVILELAAWQDGGCPLTYFVVEYKRLPGDWLLVSNNVPPQSKFPIVDLESGTSYELRVTAYNNAGSTQAEYLFSTLSPSGNNRLHDDHPQESENTPLYLDAHVLAPSVISVLAVMLAVAGVCFCLKTHPDGSGGANDPSSQTQAALDNKHNMEQREQYYATVRKPGQQSPCREVSALERIPEYSEDIYPYATFNLPEQENLSANPMRQAFFYERSETMLQGAQCDVDQYTKVRGRARRKSKSFKSESEEYDTLGSDSDTEVGTSSRTESSNHLDDSGPTSIMARSPGPNSVNQREQRLALVQRPVHHSNFPRQRLASVFPDVLYHTHESSTSTEPSPISERKTFPRLEKQRSRGAIDVAIDGRIPGILRPVLKLSESGVHSCSRGASPSRPVRPGSYDRLEKEPSSTRKSIESLCLLEEPAGMFRMMRRNDDWGSELSTLELKPPSGFTDVHETSEAECDIDMKLKLHRKRLPSGLHSNSSLSKSPKDFTITV